LERERKRAGVRPLPGSDEEREATRLARVNRVLDYMFRSEREGGLALGDQGEFDCYESIAGESDDMAVAGNWNDTRVYLPVHGPVQPGGYLAPFRDVTDDTPSRLERVLTALGVEVVWSNEYLCCDCGKGFRASPDSHSWEMYGWIGDGDYCCGDCLADMECDDCGKPDFASGAHCHQQQENTCHCGHGCEHDEIEENDDDD